MKMKVSAYRAWCHFMAKIRKNYVQNEKILCPEHFLRKMPVDEKENKE